MKEDKGKEEQNIKKHRKKKISADQFKEVINQLVKKETGKFFVHLHKEGIEVGKKQISKVNHSIMEKVIGGDKGRHFTDEENLDKVRTFVKSYLLSKFKK